jgi:aryl sulfotransferase
MSETAIGWPRKTREIHNHHMDSTVWNDFAFRDDDVIVATYAKSGTTWTQQIVGQLVFQGDESVAIQQVSPWLDLRIMPPDIKAALGAQTHRRIIKTHLPVDALVMSPKAKYLYVARDARDVVWSVHNHHRAFTPEFLEMLNGLPGRVGPPLTGTDLDVRAYYHQWLDNDAAPFWPFWSHVQSWWDIRHLPNVKLVHFANLKADMAGEIRRIAEFLEIEVAPETWPKVLEHCSFDYMKANARKIAPMIEMVLQGGADSFINRGENGRWRDVLSPAEIDKCDAVAAANLTPDCARWLKTGELPEQGT